MVSIPVYNIAPTLGHLFTHPLYNSRVSFLFQFPFNSPFQFTYKTLFFDVQPTFPCRISLFAVPVQLSCLASPFNLPLSSSISIPLSNFPFRVRKKNPSHFILPSSYIKSSFVNSSSQPPVSFHPFNRPFQFRFRLPLIN